MKLFLASVLVLFGFNALAQTTQTCLSKATNSQLINELEARLTSGGTTGEYSLATFSCFGSTLYVNLVNQEGSEEQESLSTTSASSCTTYSGQMTKKVGSAISTGIIVASCFGSTLSRLLLRADGSIKELSSLSNSSSAACDAKATEINEA